MDTRVRRHLQELQYHLKGATMAVEMLVESLSVSVTGNGSGKPVRWQDLNPSATEMGAPVDPDVDLDLEPGDGPPEPGSVHMVRRFGGGT